MIDPNEGEGPMFTLFPKLPKEIRLLIWEWPLRALYQPLTAAETAYLNAASGAAPLSTGAHQ